MALTKEEVEKAKRNVRTAFLILAKAAGVKPIRKREMPDVEIMEEGKRRVTLSHYNPEKNKIFISPENIGNGVAYFEEASHALRHISQKRKGLRQRDDKVDEFYGRVGETLGRKLTRGTKMESLFKDIPPRDVESEIQKESDKKGLKTFKRLRKKIREKLSSLQREKIAMENLENFTSKNYGKFRQTLRDFASGKIDSNEFLKKVDVIEKSYSDSTKPYLQNVSGKNQMGAYFYREFFDYVKTAFDSSSDEKGKRKAIKRELKRIDKEYKKPENHFDYLLNDVDRLIASSTRMIIQKQIRHRRAYLYGQQYSAEDLEKIKGLYDLNDDEVREVFFHRENPYKSSEDLIEKVGNVRERTRTSESFTANPVDYVARNVSAAYSKIKGYLGGVKKSLERRVAAVFFIFSIIIFSSVLFDLKLTGFVISSNFITGGIFGLIFLLFAIAFYLKFRKS